MQTMDNKSEYMIIYSSGRRRLAVLLDANLDQIAEYRAFSDEVEELLKTAEQLGPVYGGNWDKISEKFTNEERETATAYRLYH